MEPTVLTVSQLNEAVKLQLEKTYPAVYVSGEVSNLSHPASGHFYFSLKDSRAQIRCAFFKNYQRTLVKIENGDQIKALAQVSLYPDRGDYQLIIKSVEADGLGSLQQQFEALKKKLELEGLFSKARKKPLPPFPKTIGLITSETGAALQDMLHIFERRYPIVRLILFPSLVQGAEAPLQLIHMLKRADYLGICDLLILARGGGSLEDLFAFNDEQLARTIADLKTPIISGIGHEIDFTIADFVADVRAPTPSAAAEIATPDQQELLNTLEHFLNRAHSAMKQGLNQRSYQVQHLSLCLKHPKDRLHLQAQRLDFLFLKLNDLMQQCVRKHQNSLRLLHERLHKIHPERLLVEKKQILTMLNQKIYLLLERFLDTKRYPLLTQVQKLNALNPLKVLERGYALIQIEKGDIVTSVTQIKTHDLLHLRLKDGTVKAIATDTSTLTATSLIQAGDGN